MQVERYPRKGGKRRKGEEHVGTYLRVWDSGGKLPVIPDDVFGPKV